MGPHRISLNLGPVMADVRLLGLPVDTLDSSATDASGMQGDLHIEIRAPGTPIPNPPAGAQPIHTPFFSGFWAPDTRTAAVTLTAMPEALCATTRQCHGVLRLILSTWIREQGGIVLHGAALLHEGGAHVFLGASGAGKTTLAQRFPLSHRLGDDYVAILPAEMTGFDVHGTTLRGRERLPGTLQRQSLRSIALLEQAEHPAREILSPSDAVGPLLRHAFAHHQSPLERSDHLTTALKLAREVPVSRLRMTKTSDPFVDARAA